MDAEVSKSNFDVPLKDLKIEKPTTGRFDDPLEKSLQIMQKEGKGALILTKDDFAVGIISEQDFIRKVPFEDTSWLQESCQKIATPGPFTLKEDALVSDAIKLMVKRNFRHVPIVDAEDKVVGLLSIKDLLAFLTQFFPDQVKKHGILTNWTVQTVDEFGEGFSSTSESAAHVSGNIFLAHLKRVSHDHPLLLDKEESVVDAIELMRDRKRGAVVVTEYETKIKGVFTERDLLFKILGKQKIDETLKVKDYMTPSPHTLLSKHYLAHAINNMFHFKYRSTIIVDEDRYPLAIVSLLDVFKFVAFHFYGDEISLID